MQKGRILPKAGKFNHAFDFAFEVHSDDEQAEDVTGAMLRAALKSKLDTLNDEDMLQVCGCFDTSEE